MGGDYLAGDRVEHDVYGSGEVVRDTSDSGRVTVRFDGKSSTSRVLAVNLSRSVERRA